MIDWNLKLHLLEKSISITPLFGNDSNHNIVCLKKVTEENTDKQLAVAYHRRLTRARPVSYKGDFGHPALFVSSVFIIEAWTSRITLRWFKGLCSVYNKSKDDMSFYLIIIIIFCEYEPEIYMIFKRIFSIKITYFQT